MGNQVEKKKRKKYGKDDEDGSDGDDNPGFPQTQSFLGDMKEEAEVEFESKLAEGSTAVAYKGWWNGKEVTIKQFREEGEKLEFQREVYILSHLRHRQHPNIISFFTYNDTRRFIVLEFVVNGTLHELLQSDQILTWPDRISISYDIVKGFAFLHQRGVIHSDLRSANILLVSFAPYKVKIFDFSSSKTLNDPTIAEGIWCHNSKYIRWQPPEVCRRRRDRAVKIEHPTKVDVFSFAMVLVELATGKDPYHEITEISIVERTIVEGGRPKIPEEDIPIQYSDVIKKCWDADPTKRPPFEELVPFFQQLDIHGPQLPIAKEIG